MNPLNPDMSLIFHDMSQLCRIYGNQGYSIFKLLKEIAGTFHLHCTGKQPDPKVIQKQKKTVGIRIPTNAIVLKW